MCDQTRRIICRVLFFALAFLPTLGVFGWAMSYHLPGTQVRLEAQLTAVLGMSVTLTNVSHPQPGVAIYEGLKLADAEFGTPLVDIDRLQVITDRAGVTLLAGQVDVTAQGGPACWQSLQTNLRQTQFSVWQFHAEHVRVMSGGEAHPLGDFRVKNNPAVGGASALVLFRYRNGEDAQEDIQLKIARNRQAIPASTAWEIRTGANVLPVSLLQIVLPTLGKFGDEARFRGLLTFSQNDHSSGDSASAAWGCDLQGIIDQANLANLVGTVMPGAIDGTGRIEIEHAQVRDGRLNSASVLLSGGTGRISGLLVLAAAAALELESTAHDTEEFTATMQPYERLSVALGINNRGILLRGMCENSQPGTVVGTMNGPLLRTQEPEHALQPIAGLLQMIAPRSPAVSPATPEALRLARVLPLSGLEVHRAGP